MPVLVSESPKIILNFSLNSILLLKENTHRINTALTSNLQELWGLKDLSLP